MSGDWGLLGGGWGLESWGLLGGSLGLMGFVVVRGWWGLGWRLGVGVDLRRLEVMVKIVGRELGA